MAPAMASQSPEDLESSGDRTTIPSIFDNYDNQSSTVSSGDGDFTSTSFNGTTFAVTTDIDYFDVGETSGTYITSVALLTAVLSFALLTLIVFFAAMMWYKTSRKASYYVHELKDYNGNLYEKDQQEQNTETLIDKNVMNVCDIKGNREWLV